MDEQYNLNSFVLIVFYTRGQTRRLTQS